MYAQRITLGILVIGLFGSLPPAYSALAIDKYIDTYDRQYIRIKSVEEDQYVAHIASNDTIICSEHADIRDQHTHWYLESTTEPGQYWIRNRVTDASLHIENLTGDVQIAPLAPTFTSYRWIFETEDDFFKIRSAWQSDAYLTSADETNTPFRYLPRQNQSTAQQFILEPISIGGTFPWTRYDESNAKNIVAPSEVIGINYTASMDRSSIATEAHGGTCISLEAIGSQVEWIVTDAANVLTLRYSVLDGDMGTITLNSIPGNGDSERTQKISLNSNQAWVYFDAGTEYNTPATGRIAAKRYAEARIHLSKMIDAGDIIRLTRESDDVPTWIDLIETETSINFTPIDLNNYYVVTAPPWNATGDGITNDTDALQNCIDAAASAGKKVYIPDGRYNLQRELVLPENAIVEGAGIWATELYFSKSTNFRDGGVRGNGSNIELRGLYITGSQIKRENGYHGVKGLWAGTSIIEDIWIENTTTGMWISDLDAPHSISDGLVIRNCRIRNTFADGINLAGGTRNTTVENSHFRSTGDDALASWSSGHERGLGMTQNNRMRYNTIECGYRAGGIAIFGGQGHRVHHNLVQDQYIGAGIRGSTLFFYTSATGNTRIGHGFSTTEPMRIYKNTLQRTGSRGHFGNELGAIDLQTSYGNVNDIVIEDITVESTHYSGIRLNGAFVNTSPAPEFQSMEFRNIDIIDAPLGVNISGSALGSAIFENVIIASPALEYVNTNSGFVIIETGSQVHFSHSNGNGLVSEAGDNDTYSVVLATAPTAEVIITTLPDVQVSTSPVNLTFNSTNWNTPQIVTINAINDDLEESLHSASIMHSANSLDPLFTSSPLPDIDVQIVDNDQNRPPVVTIETPERVAIPANVGLMIDASISDDNKPLNADITAQWSVISKPAGATATFDNNNATDTGVTFDHEGTYQLRLTASDSLLSGNSDLTIHYGATSARILLDGGDIGNVGIAGSYEKNADLWTIRGSGYDVWNSYDEFYFLSAPFEGDGTISICLHSQTNTFEWAKAGLMIRDTLEADSSHALLAVTPSNGMAFQHRTDKAAMSDHTFVGTYNFPVWIKLERLGSTITAYRSDNSLDWENLGSTTPTMSGRVHVGIFVTSHNNAALSEATFSYLEENVWGLGPAVNTGEESQFVIGQTLQLNGSVSDDGLPRPTTLSTQWITQSGPNAVNFNSTEIVNPIIGGDTAGDYILRMIADDGSVRTFHDMKIQIQTELVAWRKLYFGTPDNSTTGLNEDPDNDGLNNLQEYAFGANPLNPTEDISPLSHRIMTSADSDSEYLEFNYRRLHSPYSGIEYHLETTTDLAANSWSTSAEHWQQIGNPQDNEDGTETVTIRLTSSLDEASTQFFRIKLEVKD